DTQNGISKRHQFPPERTRPCIQLLCRRTQGLGGKYTNRLRKRPKGRSAELLKAIDNDKCHLWDGWHPMSIVPESIAFFWSSLIGISRMAFNGVSRSKIGQSVP